MDDAVAGGLIQAFQEFREGFFGRSASFLSELLKSYGQGFEFRDDLEVPQPALSVGSHPLFRGTGDRHGA